MIPDPHGSLVDGLPGMQDLHFKALLSIVSLRLFEQFEGDLLLVPSDDQGA